MRTNKSLFPIIGLIIGAASFLISFAQLLSKVPDAILMRGIVIGEVVALLALLLVVLKLGSSDPPQDR